MVRLYSDQEALSVAAAHETVAVAESSMRARGRFVVAVSGGSTPARLYELLSQAPWRDRMPWARTDMFWVDERCVSPDSPESNYRLVRDRLLSRLGSDAGGPRAHRMAGEMPDPDVAARAYEDELRRALTALPTAGGAAHEERFDLVLLGMGTDGHTASLFPGAAALEETERWVVSAQAPSPPHRRLTMTLPLLQRARRAFFLVSGEAKAAPLAAILASLHSRDPGKADATHGSARPTPPPAPPAPRQALLPAARIALVDGNVDWFVDLPAAASLSADEISSPEGVALP